jgi:hypothetical protein
MIMAEKKYAVLSGILCLLNIQVGFAGPPFDTDDPEPLELKHWEYYLSSVNSRQTGIWSGTIPHIEVNYGLAQNVMAHLEVPMNYDYSSLHGFKAGYADTEVGIKYRFIQETENSPQVGTFPILEIPTIRNKEFSDGKIKIYLPVWMQKSWGKLTTYGGAGYWINPGTNNKNWLFAGWEVQYDFSSLLKLGGELFYHSASTEQSSSGVGFNLGGFINLTKNFHIIFSVGHSLINESVFSSYVGLYITI